MPLHAGTMRTHRWNGRRGRAFHRDLDMLTPSLPLSRSLDLPVCLARFPSARLWIKDESLEDSVDTQFIGEPYDHRLLRVTLSSSRNAVSISSACTTKRFPSSRCASTIQIV